MGFVEMTGKTVEEALAAALAELQTTKDNVEVEILEEAKDALFGLFGGRKAKIRVTVKASAEEAVAETLVEEPSATEDKQEPVAEKAVSAKKANARRQAAMTKQSRWRRNTWSRYLTL
jgi:spoIIIJ-associated protein